MQRSTNQQILANLRNYTKQWQGEVRIVSSSSRRQDPYRKVTLCITLSSTYGYEYKYGYGYGHGYEELNAKCLSLIQAHFTKNLQNLVVGKAQFRFDVALATIHISYKLVKDTWSRRR